MYKRSSKRRSSKRRSKRYRNRSSGYAPVQYDIGVCKRSKNRYNIQTSTDTWEPVGDLIDCRLPKAPELFVSCNDPDGPSMTSAEMRIITQALGIPEVDSRGFSVCRQINEILFNNTNPQMVKSLRPSIPKLAELWYKYRRLGIFE